MVFEVFGKNLLGLIMQSKFRGIHIDNVRHIMRQVLLLGLITASP